MSQVSKLLSLTSRERWLLVKAATLLVAVRLALSVLPFPRAHQLCNWASRGSGRIAGENSVERLAWTVEAASRYVPGGRNCLTKAFAARILLARRGHPAIVRYGVLREPARQFMAHAWLESDGMVLIGGHGLDRFVPLTRPDPPPR